MESKESGSLIYRAEMKRVMGSAREAIEDARRNATLSSLEIKSLSSEELVDKMRLWRIWAVTLMSLHKKEWNGKIAVEYLFEARDLFRRYYNHPSVKEAAPQMRTDPEGNEYQMTAEMNRDKGKFYFYAAGLTGKTPFLDSAYLFFNKAVLNAEEETSAWAVATMEGEITKRKCGRKIDFKRFNKAYQIAVELSPEAGGTDRMAAVSWWCVRESLLAGRRNDLRLGLNNLRTATQELGISWIKKYPLREISSSLLGAVRRVTLPKEFLQESSEFNYSHLNIELKHTSKNETSPKEKLR